MTTMTGWYQFRVYCNESLIASFQTQAQQAAFIKERKARYPSNHYHTGLDRH